MRKGAAAAWVALSLVGCASILTLPAEITYGPELDGGVTAEASVSNSPLDHDAPPGSRCSGMKHRCGPNHSDDCCGFARIPGATFKRSYDEAPDGKYADPRDEATVDVFDLDVFEVTIQRFSGFNAAVPDGGLPEAGAGRNSANALDVGWDSAWNQLVIDGMREADVCQSRTLDEYDDTRPKACLSWYQAFAFCIWDGGRLPTEAEWNLAAAGPEQRAFPWSDPPNRIDQLESSRAVSDGPPRTAQVGSRPDGRGRLGLMDLAGNVGEWVADTINAGTTYLTPCDNCIDLRYLDSGARVFRGGEFNAPLASLRVSERYRAPAALHLDNVGVRCARNVVSP